jgi:hypothetical protein
MSLEYNVLVDLMTFQLGLSNGDITFRFNVTECAISNILKKLAPCDVTGIETNQVAKQECSFKEHAQMIQTQIKTVQVHY